jgi:arabinan endo-1,5-alpha-L-arabinosidase
MAKIKNISLIFTMTLLLSGCYFSTDSIPSSANDSSINSNTDSVSSSENNSISNSSSISETSNSSLVTSEYVSERRITSVSYKNPILVSQGEVADPTVYFDEEANVTYLFSTGAKGFISYNQVGFSPLANATYMNGVPSWGTAGNGYWAPEFIKIKDKYLLYYSLSTWGDNNPGIGVSYSSTPHGPFTDLGPLFRDNDIGVNNCIDPEVFIAQNGKVYMIFGSMRGNYLVELTDDGLALFNGLNYQKEHKIRVAGLDTSIGWTANTYEGANVFYKEGYYYLMLSTGSCCEGVNSTYKVVVGRSQYPVGPYYDKNNRIMTQGGVGSVVIEKGNGVSGPGHHSYSIDVNGDYWMYYHGYRDNDDGYRVLFLDKIIFDEEGWPYVEGKVPSSTRHQGPAYYVDY